MANNPAVARAASGTTNSFARMRPDVYDAFEQTMPKPMLTPGQNDPQYAAFLLGVQFVLKALRTGYVTA
jgi:hypothetical protein